MYINENLKTIRECKGISRTKLAHAIGTTESVVRNIESGKTQNPSIVTVKNICNYFGISIDEFVLNILVDPEKKDK